MTDLSTLDINNTAFAKLITDARFKANQQVIQRVIESIQSLQKISAVPDQQIVTETKEAATLTDDHLLTGLFEEQYQELEELKTILNHNKHKYNLRFFKQNEEKLNNYIEKIANTKSSIDTLFETLNESLTTKKEQIMSQISKQQNKALNLQSNVRQNKRVGCPIKKCIDLNEELLGKHAQFLRETATKMQSENMTQSVDISEHLESEYHKILETFNKNNDDIDKYMKECDYCTLQYPQFDETIYNQISSDIEKLLHFEECCPISINITNINFVSDTSLRIEFSVSPQREFKQCQVFYNFDEYENGSDNNNNCNCVTNGNNNNCDTDDDDEKKSIWYKTDQAESITYRANNENSMLVPIVLNDENKVQQNVYLNLKLRFKGWDNSWSKYSNVFSIIHTNSSPEPQKIKHIFYLSQDLRENPKGLYIANNATNTSTSCHVFDLLSPHRSTIRQREKWTVKYSGICYAKNILLPQCIGEKVCKLYNDEDPYSSNKRFNCLFKCGGTIGDTLASKYCSAIIMDNFRKYSVFDTTDNNINDNTEEIKSETGSMMSSTDIREAAPSNMFALNWDLPLFPQQTDCNDITYSQHYGLLSCGGWEFRYDSNKFYRLSFNSEQYFNQNLRNLKGDTEDYDYWQWEIMPNMIYKRSWPTILSLDDEYRLICIGGKGPINTVEIFSFNENKWMEISPINYARSSAGIHYDKLGSNRIYLGGGHGALQKVEYYDIHKDEWLKDLPDTKEKHGSRPVVWVSEDGNLLYIASTYSDSMEYIDLRMDNRDRSWNTVYGRHFHQLWHNVFDTKFAKSRNCRLCLS